VGGTRERNKKWDLVGENEAVRSLAKGPQVRSKPSWRIGATEVFRTAGKNRTKLAELLEVGKTVESVAGQTQSRWLDVSRY